MTKKKKNATVKKQRPSLIEALGLEHIIQIFQNERLHFFIGILLFVVSIYMMISFMSFFTSGAADQSIIENLRDGDMVNEDRKFQNICGSIGAYLSYLLMKESFGVAAFAIPLFLFVWSLKLMRAYQAKLMKWFMCLMLIMIWSSIALARYLSFTDTHFCLGGDRGMQVARWIEGFVGAPGLLAVLAVLAIAFLMYLSSETVYFIRKLLNPVKFITSRVKFEVTDTSQLPEGDSTEDEGEDERVYDDPSTETLEWHDTEGTKADEDKTETAEPAVQPLAAAKPAATEHDMVVEVASEEEKAKGELAGVGEQQLEPYDPKRDLENYHYPTLDLLKVYEDDGKPYIDMSEQTANKNRIVEVLRNFGIEISSIKATVGPTITLYEITPAQGVRISKIRNLEDDIALSLKALGIRIIAPIPGKGTIGIEVPNEKKNIVSMRSVLDSKKFQETTMDLPCAMGKTITNEVFMFDLAKAPHLLVAGATGQGKSVGLNAILTSLLYKKHPAELKIVLVDPKMVEFSIYSSIANHFLAKVPDDNASPIITDTSKVIRTLQSLCVEMDARYELLMAAGERNIKDYNRKFIARKLNPEKGHRFMPYIVVVIDEYGDLIMTAGKEIELPIARIAQKARAVGIHMIIATQRPTTNIITGTIKANFPARIAFKVSQGIDSKTILDRMGAQQLIGRGDMLYLSGNDPVRVQCAFVDTPEVDRINQYIAAQQGYLEPFELPEPVIEGDGGGDGGSNEADLSHLDPMFDDAARLIVSTQQGSTSLIQRKFSIGYNRAGRLMDQLEKAGIVGQAHGSKPREVLIQDDLSLEQLLSNLR